MSRKAVSDIADLSHLACEGAEIAVRVTPRAAALSVREEGGVVQVRVTAAPEAGKANAAVAEALARALGVPKSRLALLRGASARDKLFRIG